jgi:hypothetical protein
MKGYTMNEEQINLKIAELNQELVELKKEKEQLEEARKKETKPIFNWTITPVQLRKNDTFEFIFDETVVMYKIVSTCINIDEVKDAGWPSWDWLGGSMNYLFNKLTGLLITSIDGGTAILMGGDTKRWGNVSTFLVNNPLGGDITKLMEK